MQMSGKITFAANKERATVLSIETRIVSSTGTPQQITVMKFVR